MPVTWMGLKWNSSNSYSCKHSLCSSGWA